MAHPLRRRRLSFPAARLDVTVNDTVVAIVSAFFVIGIAVGVIAVAALPVLRAGRRRDPGDPPGYEPPRPGEPPPGPRWGDAGPDDPPRWPGDAGNDFSAG